MKKLLLALMCFQSLAFADSLKLGLVDVIEPESSQDNYIVLATDGRAYEIDARNLKLVDLAREAVNSDLNVKIELSGAAGSEDLLEVRNEILKIRLLSTEKEQFVGESFAKDFYTPERLLNDYITNFSDEATMNKIFYAQRTDTTMRSQCYNRAHVWSWEMGFNYVNGQRVQPGKVWLFFTKRYIKEYKYKWWFHISPYVKLNNDIRVMDRSFIGFPAFMQVWTNTFIASEQKCPVITKYSEYKNNPMSGHCFVLLSSVHYWQPYQLEKAENEGIQQTEWNSYEVKKAYKNAIGIFSRVPERD